MAYTRINWENQPSENTPISAENLNIMDLTIDTIDASIGTLANLTTTEKTNLVGAVNELDNDIQLGWNNAEETWTFSSTDNPSGAISISGDKRGKYTLGMRIKFLNNSNTIYGIITKIDYTSPNTIITFLHEINPTNSQALYIMTNSAITNNYYSNVKAPFGFPLNPDKWTIKTYSDLEQGTTNPTMEVYYNKLSLSFKPGLWNTFINGNLGIVAKTTPSTTQVRANVTLSTSATTKGANDITCYVGLDGSALATGIITLSQFSRNKIIEVTSATTYYLNISSVLVNAAFVGLIGNQSRSELKAVCAYL